MPNPFHAVVSPGNLRTRIRWLSVLTLACLTARAQLIRQTPTGLTLPATVPATDYALRDALGSRTFNQPVAVVSPPGDTTRVFVVERTGLIKVVRLSSFATQTFLDVRAVAGVAPDTQSNFLSDSESGLLGLAFHPRYATNRTFFIFYSVRVNGQRHQRLARLRTSVGSPDLADPASHEPLITQYDESANHNGGDLHFGPDGHLYVALGDEGGYNDYFDNARWVDRDFHAALLRLDVDRQRIGQPGGSREPNPHPAIDRDTGGLARYAIPPDNPLLTGAAGTLGPIGAGAYPSGGPLDATKLRTEFFAYGLRNPWRFSFDPPTGRLFVADVGQDKREEINLVAKGANLGWPYREGLIAGPNLGPPASPLSPPLDPIHDYPRSDGYSVTGGVVYRGSAFPEWAGTYVFADYSGLVYALRENVGRWTRELVYRGSASIVGIGRHPSTGELLFADISSGRVLELARQSRDATLPPTLSATGLFTDLDTLTPAPGIVPYEINHPAWNDHARPRHWFAFLQANERIDGHALKTAWSPPRHAIWVQHLELATAAGDHAPVRRIETRVMVRNFPESYGVSYRWREDGSDADLVPAAGAEFDVTLNDAGVEQTRRWRVPGWTDCRACHTSAAGLALSFDTRQLNRETTHGSVTDNQLRHLAAAGYISVPPASLDHATLPAHAAPDDASQSIEHRLRGYLAVNCISCHRSLDTAPSSFTVAPEPGTAATRLRHAIPENTGGDPDARLLAPGAPEHSMLLRRILGDGVRRMPPVGPREIDPRAESLLRAYIAQLPTRPLYDDWHHAHFVGGIPVREAETDPDGDGSDNRLEYLAHTSPVSPNPDPLNLRIESTPAGRIVRFLQPAERFAVVEYQDGFAWSAVAPSGDGFGYPSVATEREVLVPADYNYRAVRVRLEER